jgi:hypothetical protein
MQQQSDSRDPGKAGGRAGRTAGLAAAAAFILVGVASFLPSERLWGVNHLAFYPLYVRVVLLSLIALTFVAPVRGPLCAGFARAARMARRRLLTRAGMPAVAVLSVGVFWLLKSSTLLLGDARLVASNFEHAFDPAYNVIVGSPRTIILQEPIAKGTALLYHYAARAGTAAFGGSPVDGIRFLNCILGGILIYILMREASKSTISGVAAAWAAFLVLTSGAMELFFGYVENYTPLVFFGALYVVAGLKCMAGGSGRQLAAAIALMLVAVFMHVQGILLAPSCVLLVIWAYRNGRDESPARMAVILGAITAGGAFILGAFTSYGRHFLSALTTGEAYGIVSPAHLADIANEVLLLIPSAIIIAGLAFSGGKGRPGRIHETGRKVSRPPQFYFAILLLVPSLIFLFAFKPDLGMARDWDLFALTSLALIPLAVMMCTAAVRGFRERDAAAALAPAWALSFVLASGWVGINADPGLSARRFEAILQYDHTRAPYAYEVLSQHYRGAGDLEKALAAIEKGLDLTYNARLMALAADLYEEKGDTEAAINMRLEILRKQPGYEGARRDLVLLLNRLGRYGELLEVAGAGTRYHPQSPVYHYFYGMALIRTGSIEQGIAELLISRRLGPGEEATENIDRVLSRLKNMGWNIEEHDSATRFRIPGK